ncbi:protein ABHD13 [Diorhabda carinulata]|uniref:protein ABHD13 n=1 Tax=Diorhabda sublineata TaxID=1163346 RepID=UPI0024E0D7FF|nr:protein ABHD13 [Diorhabda sublineata]XP_057661793.1 protein ABHD13 [Diorhabda carinulata]
MGGYVPFARITTILFKMLLRVWAYSGLVLVFCCLIYYMYGGMFAVILLFFAVTGILYHIQDSLLYNSELPTHSRVYVPIPSTFNLPYESITTNTSDGIQIHMYFIYQPKEKGKNSPTILFFHGNAGNIGHRLQNCVGLYHNLHCNILLVEYRGYGLSEGVPSEEGLYIDAKTSLDYLISRNDINHSQIIIFGRSLGGAVAVDLATREEYLGKIWCLIVENTFTSIPDMGKVLLGWRILQYFPLFFYKNKFLSYQKVKNLRIPTLFISGTADSLVPPRMMAELHNRCGSARKQLLQVPAGTHNETWLLQGYYRSMAVFLQSCSLDNINNSNFDIKVASDKNNKSESVWIDVQTV